MSATTDQIDTELATYLPAIQAKQAGFLAQAGVYFQGLPSCSAVPADGAAAVIDQWDSAPAYEGTSWRVAWGGDPPAMTSQLTVDQYVSPLGPGYTITAGVLQSGRLWQRVINNGPETWRDQPWADVTPGV